MHSDNDQELQAIGQKIGRHLDRGDVLVLTGDLGSGKTTLTKGIATGLEITQMIKSPTYTIVREYEGRLPLYHLDVYRINGDADSIDLDDFLFGDGVTVIEWGELIDAAFFPDYLQIRIRRDGDGRQLDFIPHGQRFKKMIESIKNA